MQVVSTSVFICVYPDNTIYPFCRFKWKKRASEFFFQPEATIFSHLPWSCPSINYVHGGSRFGFLLL